MWDKSHPFVTKPYGLGSPKRTNLLGVGLRCKIKNGENPDTPQMIMMSLSLNWTCWKDKVLLLIKFGLNKNNFILKNDVFEFKLDLVER